MQLEQFSFALPESQIARYPRTHREDAKLLWLEKETGAIHHLQMRDLPSILDDRVHLVLNDSRVTPSALHTEHTGITELPWVSFGKDPKTGDWRPLGHPSDVANSKRGAFPLTKQLQQAELIQKFLKTEPYKDQEQLRKQLLEQGRVTYPSYLAHFHDLYQRGVPTFYNNEYAVYPGSIAPPSGGMNLTRTLLDALKQNGVGMSWLTLHVGHVTFRRPTAENIDNHQMEGEAFRISPQQSRAIDEARKAGKKLIAVGTTTTRTLEYVAQQGGLSLQGHRGMADIFLKPGHTFQLIDGLITGFHGPCTTLLMLVCALGGMEPVKRAYRAALERGYQWYTLGDSMLIL